MRKVKKNGRRKKLLKKITMNFILMKESHIEITTIYQQVKIFVTLKISNKHIVLHG